MLPQTVVLHFSTCTSFLSPLLHFASRLYCTSYRVQVLPKERRDHYERHAASLLLSTFQHCTHRSGHFSCLVAFSPSSSRSSGLSFSFSPPCPPYSPFRQLLVSPNNCHVDVDRRNFFHAPPCKCGSLRWRGGPGVRTVTGLCIRLRRLPDKPMSATSPQGGHKCIMALRSTRSRQAQGGLWYTVDINRDKVMNMINNLR